MTLLLTLLACGAEQATPDQLCAEVATAVAHRVYVCTEDEAAANNAWNRITDETTCLIAQRDTGLFGAMSQGYNCPAAIAALDCAAVEQNGDDPAAWLATDSSCASVLAVGSDSGSAP